MDYTHIELTVASKVSQRRYDHCISTALETQRLLNWYRPQLSLHQEAYLAGVWHDSAREWDNAALLDYCVSNRVPFQEIEGAYPMLLHGVVAADTIRQIVPQVCQAVCTAIRWHTLGSRCMGILGAALYAADYMEPLRTHLQKGERDALLACATIEELCHTIAQRHHDHVVQRGKRPAESTMSLIRFLAEGGRFP